MDINLGYACINTELRELGIFSSKTCRLATYLKNPQIIDELIDLNMTDLMKIL